MRSYELQYIGKQVAFIGHGENSGSFRPDLCDYLIPLFSDRLKNIMDNAGVYSIIEKRVGYYKIFKLKGVSNEFFIVNEKLKSTLEEQSLKGIRFRNIKDFNEF